MTAIGSISLERTYFSCSDCKDGNYPLDGRLGIDGFLTRQATRLACRAGAGHSFAEAEDLLADLCGWRISDERLRQACHEEARRIAGWQVTTRLPRKLFPKPTASSSFRPMPSKSTPTPATAT